MFLIKDEEPAESFWWLKESDFISLFNQFPMTSVFQYILGIDSMESGMTLVNIILEIIDQIVILFFQSLLTVLKTRRVFV